MFRLSSTHDRNPLSVTLDVEAFNLQECRNERGRKIHLTHVKKKKKNQMVNVNSLNFLTPIYKLYSYPLSFPLFLSWHCSIVQH